MSKEVVAKRTGQEPGIQLIRETLSDGSMVYQIEITEPVTIVCVNVDEAFDIFTFLDKLWIEKGEWE